MEATLTAAVPRASALVAQDAPNKNTSQPPPTNTASPARGAPNTPVHGHTSQRTTATEQASNNIYKGADLFLLEKENASKGRNHFLPVNIDMSTGQQAPDWVDRTAFAQSSSRMTAQEQTTKYIYSGGSPYATPGNVATAQCYPSTSVPSPSLNIKMAAQNSLDRAIAASPQTPPSGALASPVSLVTPQGVWQNVTAPALPHHTPPSVQNFIQLAYQTAQRPIRPQIPATAVHHAFPSTLVVTPRSPQTNLPPPFPSFQKAATSSPVTTAAVTPKPATFDAKISVINQTVTPAEGSTPLDVQTPSTSQIKNTQVTSISQPSLQFEQNSASPENETPPKRNILVAKRHLTPKSQPTETQIKNKEAKVKTSIDETPNAQNSKAPDNNAKPKESPVRNTSRVAQTYKEFQREKAQKQAQNAQSSNAKGSNKSNWRLKELEAEEQIDPKKRVIVSGFPAYTQAHDLVRVLSKFGQCRVDCCRNRLAVVTFENETEVKKALEAAHDINIFGDYIEMMPYTSPKHVNELYKEFKKVISTEKGQEITMPDKIDLSGDFYQQLDSIQHAIRITAEQALAVNNLYNDLEKVLQQEWPGCVAIPFGSIPTGLGIKSSDADCYIELPAAQRARAAATFVNRARRLLTYYPRMFTHLVAIPRANTPIVKFRHAPSGFHCDVSAKTPLGAQNSKLIKLLFERDERLQRVAILIKYWAKVHDLTGTGRLTNYALTMMVVFYLQQPHVGFLPSVEALQRNPATRYMVDYWNAGFSTKRLPPVAKGTAVHDLLGGFFEFYDRFDFDSEVVCPFLGRTVRKLSFEFGLGLPAELMRYVENVRANVAGPIRYGTAFCVQDPFEQSHNVASSVGRKLAVEIRAYIKFAADAYRADRINGCRNFLRTILLSKPKFKINRITASTVLHLIPRVRGKIADAEWRAPLREIVLDIIFGKILRSNLKRQEREDDKSKERRRSMKLDREKYLGTLQKPVWRRKKQQDDGSDSPQSLVQHQTAITDEILAAPGETPLNFDLELWFIEEPRNFSVSFRVQKGDIEYFRQFAQFLHSSVLDWFRVLVRPHLAPGERQETLLEALKVEAVESNLDKEECPILYELVQSEPEPPSLLLEPGDALASSIAAVNLAIGDDSNNSDTSKVEVH